MAETSIAIFFKVTTTVKGRCKIFPVSKVCREFLSLGAVSSAVSQLEPVKPEPDPPGCASRESKARSRDPQVSASCLKVVLLSCPAGPFRFR